MLDLGPDDSVADVISLLRGSLELAEAGGREERGDSASSKGSRASWKDEERVRRIMDRNQSALEYEDEAENEEGIDSHESSASDGSHPGEYEESDE